jgi:hypothetical protein
LLKLKKHQSQKMPLNQGDQMSYEKVAKNVAQYIFCQNDSKNPNRGKSSLKMWPISVSFNKLPKVNNHSIGEISPNLVTLLSTYVCIHTMSSAKYTRMKLRTIVQFISTLQSYLPKMLQFPSSA